MTVSIDLLTELDASFLYMESPHTPMHMGSIGVFEGRPLHDTQGCLRLDEVRGEVRSRLQLVPRLRKVVRLPLLGESAPVWVDDPDFDITYHVREAAVPEPGDETQLLELCARLMSCPLDRDRPLWQIWVIDGLADGRVAVLEMIHHCMADGLAGVELASVLLDLEPHPLPHHHSIDGWEPAPAPRRAIVLADGLAQLGGIMSVLAADGWHALWHPSQTGRVLSRYTSAFYDLVSQTPVAPHLSLNALVGFDRRALLVREPMDDLRLAERNFGVTLNDLLLTAVAAGVHDLLSARGEVMEGRELQVLVPVGADHHGDHQLGNEMSAMLVRLPIGAAPAVERLREVAEAERSRKEHGQAQATHLLLSSLNTMPPMAVSAASRLMHRQPFVNLVVTNVPGPAVPLYMLGARMLEVIPLVPLGGNLSVGVAALSYNGVFTIGVFVDPGACPDADVLTEGIGRCFAQLLDPGRQEPFVEVPG
jgi:WS/DGAT/MGAT family acyltransferase